MASSCSMPAKCFYRSQSVSQSTGLGNTLLACAFLAKMIESWGSNKIALSATSDTDFSSVAVWDFSSSLAGAVAVDRFRFSSSYILRYCSSHGWSHRLSPVEKLK